MRRTLLAPAVAAVVVLAGCSDSTLQAPPSEPAALVPASLAALPDAFNEEGALPAAFDPLYTGGPGCEPPGACVRYPFELPRNTTVTAFLQWLLVADDIELYLVPLGEDLAPLARSNAAETRMEFFRVTVPAGAYELIVSGSATAGTPYEVWAWFDEPADPADDLANSTDR